MSSANALRGLSLQITFELRGNWQCSTDLSETKGKNYKFLAKSRRDDMSQYKSIYNSMNFITHTKKMMARLNVGGKKSDNPQKRKLKKIWD